MRFKYSKILLIHMLLIVSFYVLLYFLGVFKLPNKNNILAWDAEWYNSIQKYGYSFIPFRTCNLAFFPLFPMLWSYIGLSGIFIGAFNVLLFVFSFYSLIERNKYSSYLILLIISIPSFLFFALPYSESLFFFIGVLLIIGFEKKSAFLINSSFFLISMTRAVTITFVPAIIITEVLAYRRGNSLRQCFLRCLSYIFSSSLGLLIAVYIQYIQTGKWFYFIEVQRYWKRQWILPKVPFTTYSSERILGIDSISVVIGICCIIILSKWSVQWLVNVIARKCQQELPASKTIFFSVLIISATSVIDVCFTHYIDNATNLWSINRHLLCSPFTIIFILWFNSIYKPQKFEKIIFITVIISGLLFTGIYSFPFHIFCYLIFFFTFILIKYYPKIEKLTLLTYLLSTVFQCFLFNDFLNFRWIG